MAALGEWLGGVAPMAAYFENSLLILACFAASAVLPVMVSLALPSTFSFIGLVGTPLPPHSGPPPLPPNANCSLPLFRASRRAASVFASSEDFPQPSQVPP